ncbi:MAG: class I SAM-dependent methyltransferase [Caldimonas sp.]
MSRPAYTGPERRRFVNRSWPLPALMAWAACWLVFALTSRLGAPAAAAFIGAGLFGAALSLLGATAWRRVFMGCGFPLSFAASGPVGSVPAWAWLLPLALLAFLYPWRTWRDAPLFPTPRRALDGLARLVPLGRTQAVLDGGCGLGDGLIELSREYPDAVIEGVEWSRPLAAVCALRCRFAGVRRGDLWTVDWSRYALVYLFQRPESMARAAAKAERELGAGAWLASLEFEIGSLVPEHVLHGAAGRRVWLYRTPFRRAAD